MIRISGSYTLLPTIVWSLTPAIDIYERCTESNSCIWADAPSSLPGAIGFVLCTILRKSSFVLVTLSIA